MKLKKTKFKNNKILKLHFIKSNVKSLTNKIYEPNNYKKCITTLKKILKIIYIYNKKNKKILFINPPKNIAKTIKNTSTHIIKSNNYKQNNSPYYNKKDLENSKNLTKPDLIVVLSQTETSTKTEFSDPYLKTTPTINLTNLNLAFSIYHLNFNNTKNNFIFSLINSIIKK